MQILYFTRTLYVTPATFTIYIPRERLMRSVSVAVRWAMSAPSVVYHLAKADRLDSILDDGQIRRFEDSECWFCESLPKMKAYMEQTVMCDGKPYYAVGGQLCRYPKFVPDKWLGVGCSSFCRDGCL